MKFIFQHPFYRKHGTKFLRFAVCGGLGACIDFGVLHLLVASAGWMEKYALLVSGGLAIVFVFFANRFFTFRAHGANPGKQVVKFALVYFLAASMNYFLSLALIYLGIHYLIAKALAIGTIMFFNYFSLNGFVFKQATVDNFQEEVFVA